MTNLMLLGELKNNIEFKDGDTFSFKDNILITVKTKTSENGKTSSQNDENHE